MMRFRNGRLLSVSIRVLMDDDSGLKAATYVSSAKRVGQRFLIHIQDGRQSRSGKEKVLSLSSYEQVTSRSALPTFLPCSSYYGEDHHLAGSCLSHLSSDPIGIYDTSHLRRNSLDQARPRRQHSWALAWGSLVEMQVGK